MNGSQGARRVDGPDPPATRTHLRLVLVAVVVIGLGFGAFSLATIPPTGESWYPKCTFHSGTGLHCPGCGVTRAAHAMLNGDFGAAFRYHLFAPVLLPFFTFIILRAVVFWAAHRPVTDWSPIRAVWLWVIVAAFLIYAVARNIPREPFSDLAPPELEPVAGTTDQQ